MKNLRTLFIVVLVLVFATAVGAQRRRGTRRPAVATPAPAQPPPAREIVTMAEPDLAVAPIPLATVNGEIITSANLEPKVRQEVEALDARIFEARRQIIELQVNTLLLETAAAKRRMAPQQLYNLEIAGKIGEPSAAEINKFIEDNKDQINQTDPVAMRQGVVLYLKGEREAKITETFLQRLRLTTPVVNVATAANLPAGAVLITVGGRPILAGTIAERLKPITYKLRLNTYQLAQQALDSTINDLLLLAEANRLNVPPEEIVRKEITDKLHTPNDAEVAKYYEENKSRIPADLASASSQIALFLQEKDRQRLEQELSQRLRSSASIRLLISRPELPVQIVSGDDDPVRGDANAPVTIIEFTDFQCSACANMQPLLEEVLKSYGNKVKLIVRDFPLPMHANARKAAEAANAANAQGKFFEYTSLLFKRQNALDVPSLKKYATELGLNRARFDAALDGGAFAAEVKHDIDDGQLYGIDSTPAIFVNGVAVTEMSIEALRAAIDRGLANAGPPKVSAK